MGFWSDGQRASICKLLRRRVPPLESNTPLRWLVQHLPSPGWLACAVPGAVAGRLAGSPLTVLAGAVAGRLELENKRVTYCPPPPPQSAFRTAFIM